MTAQFPEIGRLTPPTNAPWSLAGCWFRNLGPKIPFGNPKDGDCSSDTSSGVVSLDFSLQIALALRNYQILTKKPAALRVSEGLAIAGTVNLNGDAFVDPFADEGRLIMPITRSGSPER